MRLYFLVIYLLLTACSSSPAIMRNIPVVDVSYNLANQDINQYKDVSVRWGGIIIDVENESHFSLVQVLFYPLNYNSYPQVDQPHEGRFVIKSDEFLDPVIYAKNKKITVVGKLIDRITRTIGKKTIQVPLISSTALYLWPAHPPRSSWGNCGYGNYGYPACYFGYPFYPGGFYHPLWY